MAQIHSHLQAQPLYCRLTVLLVARIFPLNSRELTKEGTPKKNPLPEDDIVFTLLEAGNTFMETAFKSKMNTASRKKKMMKLGLPNCK